MGVRRPLRRLGQRGAVEGLVERLGPQALEQLVPGQRLVGRQQHQAEAAGVVEADLPALVGLEDDMVVPLEGMLGGARGVVQGHAARHAEMGDQGVAVVEPDQQVFRPPVDGQDRAALDPLRRTGPAAARAGRGGAGRGARCAGRPARERGRGGRFRPRAARACPGAPHVPRRAEQRGADPDMGGAQADGRLVVGAHAHADPGEAVARRHLGQQGEMQRRLLVDRRDAHQARRSAAYGCRGRRRRRHRPRPAGRPPSAAPRRY